MLLSKFGNEVLSKGAKAVLPQNLSSEWLSEIQKMADDFLDDNFDNGQCKYKKYKVDPILSACVTEILSTQNEGHIDIKERDMFEKLTMYALSVTIESVSKQADVGLVQPTLDNIFDRNRFMQFRQIRPELGAILDAICLSK
jgi:hypothetical protein